MTKSVHVGVAVFLYDDDGRFVLMKRRGSHGAGSWGLPGGYIEYGESPEQAGSRELAEELGVYVPSDNLELAGVSEATFDEAGRHFITILYSASHANSCSGHPRIVEPNKCEAIVWADDVELPDPLFPPLGNFITKNGVPRFFLKRSR